MIWNFNVGPSRKKGYQTIAISTKISIFKYFGSLNPNLRSEFQNSKWQIQYGGSEILKLLDFHQNEYLKVFGVIESEFKIEIQNGGEAT